MARPLLLVAAALQESLLARVEKRALIGPCHLAARALVDRLAVRLGLVILHLDCSSMVATIGRVSAVAGHAARYVAAWAAIALEVRPRSRLRL
jgi:hypothetical protein